MASTSRTSRPATDTPVTATASRAKFVSALSCANTRTANAPGAGAALSSSDRSKPSTSSAPFTNAVSTPGTKADGRAPSTLCARCPPESPCAIKAARPFACETMLSPVSSTIEPPPGTTSFRISMPFVSLSALSTV